MRSNWPNPLTNQITGSDMIVATKQNTKLSNNERAKYIDSDILVTDLWGINPDRVSILKYVYAK